MSPVLGTDLEGGDLELGVAHLSSTDSCSLNGIWRMLGWCVTATPSKNLRRSWYVMTTLSKNLRRSWEGFWRKAKISQGQ